LQWLLKRNGLMQVHVNALHCRWNFCF